MRLEITRKGMIEVRDPSGRLVSSNTVIEEAIEDLVADAEAHPEIETYRITYPSREVRVIPKVVVVPVPNEVLVQGSGIQFTQGQAGSFDLGAAIASAVPSGHVVTSIMPNKTLPSGVSADLANVQIDYDGAGPAATVGSAQDPIDLVVVTQQASAESDWQARISGPGVVFAHDFRSDAEVNNFRWTSAFGSGNDPLAQGNNAGTVRRITSDGITGGALECLYPANQSMNSIHWIRPLSALTSPGNGKAANDPAASGALPVRSYSPTSGGSQISGFSGGWWGHPSQGSASKDGREFFVQVRCKMDPRRITGGNESLAVGKFIWISTCASSAANGEHVTYSYGNPASGWPAGNYWRMYRMNGAGTAAIMVGSDAQPGGVSTPWAYSGGWDTLLYHFRPGLDGVSSGVDACRLIVYAAHPGETAYTEIVNVEYAVSGWNASGGHNALYLTAYNNNASFPQEFWHRYAQVIMSTQFIPCPQA